MDIHSPTEFFEILAGFQYSTFCARAAPEHTRESITDSGVTGSPEGRQYLIMVTPCST